MLISNLVFSLFIGFIVGGLFAKFMKGRGLGIPGDLVVGVIGALVGALVGGFIVMAISFDPAAMLISALVGAIVLLFVVSRLKYKY